MDTDIQTSGGTLNTPVLGKDGFVRLIINQVDDLTVVLECGVLE
jgi:hypothetical protein